MGWGNDDRVSDDRLKKELEKYLVSHIYEEEKDFAVLMIGMNSVVLESEPQLQIEMQPSRFLPMPRVVSN